MLGRRSSSAQADVVLGDNMNLSRRHACIAYNFQQGMSRHDKMHRAASMPALPTFFHGSRHCSTLALQLVEAFKPPGNAAVPHTLCTAVQL